jgi:MFS transporter, SHS family, lactate transporter
LFAWTWDAFDYFSVVSTIPDLSKTFDKSITDMTWGVTLVLLFRPVGAIVFGIAADRYGRRWPFIINNALIIVLELSVGFCRTFNQFLAVRALFGITMGGIYGNASATALEDAPKAARGLLSGILQQGYALGYLLATAFYQALVNRTSHGWAPLFWFGACPPIFLIVARYFMDETDNYRERIDLRRDRNNAGQTFLNEGKDMLRKHWILLAYLVFMMTGFHFMVRILFKRTLQGHLLTWFSLTVLKTCTSQCSSRSTCTPQLTPSMYKSQPIVERYSVE